MNSKAGKKKKRLTKSIKPSLNIHQFIDQSSDAGMRQVNQDLMVGKYLEECVNANKPPKPKECKRDSKSPYLAEANMEMENSFDVNKSNSKTFSNSKFIPHPPRRNRPVSAPVYRHGIGSWTGFEDLSSSGAYAASLFSTASSSRRNHKPMYKRKKHVLCVLAFINGSRETYAKVTAPDIPQLLIVCTSKLGLTSAARKIFLRDGTQVIHCKQLVKDCEVFVSTGESFKDPMLNLKEREKLRKSSYWTLNGIMVPPNGKKSKRISSALSKRMNERIDSQKRRILVFRNGECSGGVEVIANKFDEFLADCTSRLGMTTGARCLYDWNGKLIEDFSEVPMLHKVLQPSTGVVLGPLWVSKGELFSPRGAYNFLSTMIINTKERIIDGRVILKQLEEQLLEENTIIDVDGGIGEQKIMLEGLEETLLELRNYIKNIKGSYDEEEKTRSTYKFKHINEIDSSSRLICAQSLKVQLYPNGINNVNPIKIFLDIRQLKKGTTTKSQAINNYLNLVNSLRGLHALFGVFGTKIIVKRSFLINGCEVDDLDIIGQDEQVWLSLGEAFIPVNYTILSINLDKAKVHDLWGWKQIVQRDFWMGADENQTKSKLWQVVSCIPSECDTEEMKVAMSNPEKIAYFKQSCESRIRDDAIFIQSKQDHSLVLYPDVSLLSKSDGNTEGNLWGDHLHQWSVSQDGLITNRHFKYLYLGMLDQPVKMTLESDGDSEVLDGTVVSLVCRHQASNEEYDVHPYSYWEFTTDGYIHSSSNPGYVLTAVQDFLLDSNTEDDIDQIPHQGSQQWEITSSIRNQIVVTEHHSDSENEFEDGDQPIEIIEEKTDQQNENENVDEKQNPFENIDDNYGGVHINLVALPRFPAKHSLVKNQRWGIKSKEQSVPHSLCDKWVRQNLSWPVDQGGHNVKGSVEGYLVFGVPSLKWKSGKGNEMFNVAVQDKPLKVRVLRNGVTDTTRSVSVVINESKNARRSNTQIRKASSGAEMGPQYLEFMKFLDSCTYALRLPSAARRVFSSDGKELVSLDLDRDDLVYVSCGEGWIDPSLSYAEQQKSGLLATLVSDVAKIRRFIDLKKQTGYVVKVDETISSGDVRLCLTMMPDEEEVEDSLNDNNEQPPAVPSEKGVQPEEEAPLTAHERSHAKLDVTHELVDVEDEEEMSGAVYERKLSGSKENFFTFQWLYTNEFFHLRSNMELVMAVEECRPNQEVILAPKRLESPYQRWSCTEDGMISLKYNSNMVLTVATPPKTDTKFDEYADGYDGAKLIISNRKMLVNGNSNQAFYMDNDTGYLHVFATDENNKDVTAANKAGICSFAVFGKNEIYQPGYIWQSMDSNQNTVVHMFCDACGKAIRGKEKLQALAHVVQFSCAMGEAKEKNIRFIGAFQSLNGKVDLSQEQCKETLTVCELHLQRLREKSRLRAIASELSMANNPAVRILAHRNGENSSNKGILIIGRTIPEILDICTMKLDLQQAARRLYTIDGEMITHMHQLLTPYYPVLSKQQGKSPNTKVSDDSSANHEEGSRLDLRVPILVWVSTGEPFIPIDDTEKVELLNSFEFIEKRETFSNLELEKHCLRQAKGRSQSLGDLANGEQDCEDSIDHMRNQLKEVKSQQEKRAKNLKLRKDSTKLLNKMNTMKLYQMPQALRLHVFPNGEFPGCTQVIFARNMEELLDHASNKLALTSCARRAYTEKGKEIFSFDELSRDQTVCISCGEKFVPYKNRRNQIEMRATWSRANRLGDMGLDNVNIRCMDMETNRNLVYGQPPRPSQHEISLHEYNDGAKPTDAVLTRRPKLLQGKSRT